MKCQAPPKVFNEAKGIINSGVNTKGLMRKNKKGNNADCTQLAAWIEKGSQKPDVPYWCRGDTFWPTDSTPS